MKLSERIRKAPDATFKERWNVRKTCKEWADEVAKLEEENERRRELLITREMTWGNFTRRVAEKAVDALLTGE